MIGIEGAVNVILLMRFSCYSRIYCAYSWCQLDVYFIGKNIHIHLFPTHCIFLKSTIKQISYTEQLFTFILKEEKNCCFFILAFIILIAYFLLIFVHGSKNLVEKIRVSVFASHQSQLIYTQKLYRFQTENAGIEPLNIQELCEQSDDSQQTDEKPTDLMFSNEWTHQKVYTLKKYNSQFQANILCFQLNYSKMYSIRIMRL